MSTPDLRDTVKHVNDVADAIMRIDKIIPQLTEKLNDDALVILIKNCIRKEARPHVVEVLRGMGKLKQIYLKDTDGRTKT